LNRPLRYIEQSGSDDDRNLAFIKKELERLIGKINVSHTFFKIPSRCLDEVTKKVFQMDKQAKFVVVRPTNIFQVQKIVQYANKNRIYIFIRGGGSGYFGGELPTRQGIVIETTALNRIKGFDRHEGFVICQAGTTVQELNNFLKKHGFWWPHNPGSRRSATVGGSLSSLGIGTFCTRFGYASDSVLSMTIVTPAGDIVKLGSNSRHDMSSYNLLDMVSSAEGTLGIIVESKLKVFPLPHSRSIELFIFEQLKDAVRTAVDIEASGIYPESMEIEDRHRFILETLAPFVDLIRQRFRRLVCQKFQAVLSVSCSGSKDVTDYSSLQIEKIALKNHAKRIKDHVIVELYWKSKTEVSSWSSEDNPRSKVHTCVSAVPLYKLPKFEEIYWRLSRKYPRLTPMGIGYYIIIQNNECTSSARVKLDESDQGCIQDYESFTADLASCVVKLGGTPVSTFGVGTILVNIVSKYASPSWLALSSKLKHAMDPNEIFGPDRKGDIPF
jgi:FAD/FMN-containing dehydrogenase